MDDRLMMDGCWMYIGLMLDGCWMDVGWMDVRW